MRKVPKATYLSADEIEQLLKQRETEAAAMPKGPKRQAILKEIAQLHMYGATKRWIDLPRSKRRKGGIAWKT
jgi:hypothetical protein